MSHPLFTEAALLLLCCMRRARKAERKLEKGLRRESKEAEEEG